MQGILSSLVRTHSFLAILAATLCGSVSAQASLQQAAPDPTGATCNDLYNGGFDNGFARWNVTPCTGAFGDARPFTGASVIQVPVAGQMENVASLSASAFLDAVDSKTTGSGVQGQVTMSRDALLTHRVLRFTLRGGGYGLCVFGEPMGRFLAKVVVTNAAGLKAEQTFVDVEPLPFPAPLPCGSGTCASGIIATKNINMDLIDAGFEKGQRITIEIIVSSTMASTEPCSYGDLGGGIRVDDFRLCGIATFSSATARTVERSMKVSSLNEARLLGGLESIDYRERYRLLRLAGAPIQITSPLMAPSLLRLDQASQ